MSIPGEDGYETPDDAPSTALGYMLEEGCHDEVIELLVELLVKRGMARADVEAALETECREWLRDQQEDYQLY